VTKIRNFSLPALTRLRQTDSEFDLIYIDGCHERETVMIDSVLCWGMLKLEGLLIWDDYTYKKDSPNWERPKAAIDGFLVAYAGEYREESRTSQVIVRKIFATPRCVVRTDRSFLAKRSIGNVLRLIRNRPLKTKRLKPRITNPHTQDQTEASN
jgi:hypothetical protein